MELALYQNGECLPIVGYPEWTGAEVVKNIKLLKSNRFIDYKVDSFTYNFV